jgi:peptidoglycan-associated lipoprotein
MKAKNFVSGVAIFGLALLVGYGCSRTVAKKPAEAGAETASGSGVRSTDAGAGKQPAEPRPSRVESQPGKPTQGTSLEEFKRGTLGEKKESGPVPDIHFDFDSYDLNDDAKKTLKTLADWMTRSSNAKIEVEGHCDERGTAEYNLALGAKRAQAAKDYLTSLGVPASRLSTISYGKELPLCKESTEGCWATNRRDHFVVVSGAKPVS